MLKMALKLMSSLKTLIDYNIKYNCDIHYRWLVYCPLICINAVSIVLKWGVLNEECQYFVRHVVGVVWVFSQHGEAGRV